MASEVVNKYIASQFPVEYGTNFEKKQRDCVPYQTLVHGVENLHPFDSGSAVLSARLEEERLQQIQAEKEAKLQRFQDEVRSRVQRLQKIKAQQQIEKSYKAVELERKIIRQSTVAAERTTARKSHSNIRSNSAHLAIHASTKAKPTGKLPDDHAKIYEEQSKQVRTFTKAARQNLISRKLNIEEPSCVPAQTHCDSSYADETSREASPEKSSDCDTNPALPKEQLCNSSDTHVKEVRVRHSAKRKTGSKPRPASASSSVPDIYPGVESAEDKQQAVTQRAMFRRLFMDNERQQVRENLRMRQHQKRIEILKREKEEDRKRIEVASMKLHESFDPLSGETTSETVERERLEQDSIQQSHVQHQQKVRKSKESERFVEAIRSQLREKMAKRNIDLPALCCCGDSIWDTSPDSCANNCVFYKNPKAYAKALECVLASCDAV